MSADAARSAARDFVMAAGEMTPVAFTDFLPMVFGHRSGHSQDGVIHFICMDGRHMDLLLSAAKPHCTELKNLCVWNKSNAGLGSLYRSKHELIFVFKAGPKDSQSYLKATGRSAIFSLLSEFPPYQPPDQLPPLLVDHSHQPLTSLV